MAVIKERDGIPINRSEKPGLIVDVVKKAPSTVLETALYGHSKPTQASPIHQILALVDNQCVKTDAPASP
jgi:hypothetical protein